MSQAQPKTELKFPNVDRAHEWARAVLEGEVISNKYIRLACKRHFDDFENGAERGLFFDYEHAERVCRFYELCPHVKGPLASVQAIRANNAERKKQGLRLLPYNPIKPSDWQLFMVISLFGWRRLTDQAVEMFYADPDTPTSWPLRFTIAHICVGRKNGKTTGIAPLGLYGLCAAGEQGAEIYSAATTRDQAKIVWKIANAMINRGALKAKLNVKAGFTEHRPTDSEFRPLSADHDTLDGLNLFVGIVDELHAHKSRGLYEVLESSMGSRASQLLASITTAGIDRESICYETELMVRQVLEGVIDNDAVFGMLFTVDDEDLEDEEALLVEGPHWHKANPNLGVSVSLDTLRSEAKLAQESPRKRSNFLRKRLNVWVGADTQWLNMSKWAACDRGLDYSELQGGRCWLGLDLATKRDLASLVALFEKNGKYHPVVFNWLPKGALELMSKTHANMFEQWGKMGFVTLTEGDTCDQAAIEAQLEELRSSNDVQSLSFDPWHATRLITNLHEAGWPEDLTIQVGQTVKHLSEPMKTLEAWVFEKQITNPANPLLTWALSNVVAHEDKANNIKPNKETKANKIDPAVALIMSIARALFTKPKMPSVYETRGMRQL